ncbi:MAG: LytTR family DNA-binding domain-containing protein [Lachnospiraceae bacterium]|nr:LytTR family DNA-binding domain-containing protein [Lachnospiraceae bacterium]
MVLYIAVCDDEPVFTEHIRNLLVSDSILKGYELNIGIYQSGEALLKAWENGCLFDVIFLDILLDAGMPQKRIQGERVSENQGTNGTLNGFETAELLRKAGCGSLLVFLTSLSSYVQKGYEVRAFRYLLKSQMELEITRVMEDCRRELAAENYFQFTCEREICRVRKKDIYYLESNKRMVYLHTEKQTYHFYRKLDELEAEFCGDAFLRCHKSYLVQVRHVAGWKEKQLRMENGAVIPISRAYRDEVNRRLLLDGVG